LKILNKAKLISFWCPTPACPNQKGLWNGGLPPVGYKTVNKKLIPDEKESKIVKLIFQTYVETGSIAGKR